LELADAEYPIDVALELVVLLVPIFIALAFDVAVPCRVKELEPVAVLVRKLSAFIVLWISYFLFALPLLWLVRKIIWVFSLVMLNPLPD
jgi:hypothetical protein